MMLRISVESVLLPIVSAYQGSNHKQGGSDVG